LAQAETRREGWWKAELYRLKGKLVMQEGGTQAVLEAEESFRLALTAARSQQAKSLELRAAVCLSQL
jgi:hypothetical protein